jgi:hypothetical protein
MQRAAGKQFVVHSPTAAASPPMRNSARRTAWPLEHDPEKWVPVFRKDHAQTKKIERDDDSKKSHPVLMGKFDGEVGSGTPTSMGTARVLFLTLAVAAPAHHYWCQFFIAARW